MNLLREWFRRQLADPQVVILAGLLLAGLVVILLFSRVLSPVFAAVVMAYLLEGLIRRMQRVGIPRFPALAIVFILFLGFMGLVFFWLIPLLYQQVSQLMAALPVMLDGWRKELLKLPDQTELLTQEQITEIITVIRSELTRYGQRIVSISMATVTALVWFSIYLVLVPFLVFFMLKDKGLIIGWLSRFLPEQRSLAVQVWREVDQQIGNYVQGKFLEILIVWAVTYAVFVWLQLPYAMLLAVFVGLSVLVPYIGAMVMAVPIALIAYFEFGWGSHFFWVVTAYLIIQLLDGNVLAPLLLSEVTNLHPIAVIVAVLVFGGIWGFWGMVFAIPLATLVHAVIKAWPTKVKEGVGPAEGI